MRDELDATRAQLAEEQTAHATLRALWDARCGTIAAERAAHAFTRARLEAAERVVEAARALEAAVLYEAGAREKMHVPRTVLSAALTHRADVLAARVSEAPRCEHGWPLPEGRPVSLMPAAEVAREWFYNADYPNECASQAEVDDLAALVERVRAEALQAAAEVAQRFDPALDPGILPLRILGPIPARLDPEGTAKGKTILTAEMVGHNGPVPWPGPASTHVDIETGKRTALGDDPCGSCGHPLAGHLAGYGCGAGGGVCKCPVGQ